MPHTFRADELQSWLVATSCRNGDYRHVKLVEDSDRRSEAIPVLRSIVNEVHQDAKRYLSNLTRGGLDPLGETQPGSIADVYPQLLHHTTRKAYFGEIMAGIVAENFSSTRPGKWRVPALLFRHHELAFDELERWRMGGAAPRHVPGQSGDDCLAFSTGETEHVVASLVSEAKCTNSHNMSMVANAHKKISSPELKPISLSRVIAILDDKEQDAESVRWADMLRELYYRRDLRSYKRSDLIAYTCGQMPTRSETWMDPDQPHRCYAGNRELECVEIHLSNVDALVDDIYGLN